MKICRNEEGWECVSYIFKTYMMTIGRDGWTEEGVGTKKNVTKYLSNAIRVHLAPSMIMLMVLVS